MRIEHIALYVSDLEKSKEFFEKYFMGKSGKKHIHKSDSLLSSNPPCLLSSYFISFSDGGRMEIMNRSNFADKTARPFLGYAHIAMSVGSPKKVIEITEQLAQDGYEIASEPRKTDEGHFESCILDRDGNQIEITI